MSGARAGVDGAVWIPVQRWSSTHVLRVVDSTGATNYTWGGFLNTYANKWGGAHLDRTLPTHLPTIDTYEAGGHLLSAYLLRSAAVQAWMLGQVSLEALFGKKLDVPDGATDVVLGAPGSIGEPPRDRRSAGELQFLTKTGKTLDLVAYYDRGQVTNIRVSGGGLLGYDITLGGERDALPPTQRARDLAPPSGPLVASRMMKVKATVRPFDEVDTNDDTECGGD